LMVNTPKATALSQLTDIIANIESKGTKDVKIIWFSDDGKEIEVRVEFKIIVYGDEYGGA